MSAVKLARMAEMPGWDRALADALARYSECWAGAHALASEALLPVAVQVATPGMVHAVAAAIDALTPHRSFRLVHGGRQ